MEDIVVCPVVNVSIGPVPARQLVLIRFDFLTHPSQAMGQAHPGRNYVLTVEQAQHVRDSIDQALRTLQSAGPERAEGPLQ